MCCENNSTLMCSKHVAIDIFGHTEADEGKVKDCMHWLGTVVRAKERGKGRPSFKWVRPSGPAGKVWFIRESFTENIQRSHMTHLKRVAIGGME